MRRLILRTFAVVAMIMALFQAVPAMAATFAPAGPTTPTQAQIASQVRLASPAAAAYHRWHHRSAHRTRTDHELVVKAWANIRTAPTTAGNHPVAHFAWHDRFTAYHRIVYGQHPYGPGSSNHWLKIASGRYRGDFVWADGIVDPHVSRSPPVITATAASVQVHRHYRPARRYHVTRRHHTARRHYAVRHYRRRYHSYSRPRYYAGGGTLGCSGLESLWVSAGGASWAAVTAASIAMAESGGRQYAHSPTDDYGYWQINGSHGPGMATYSAYGNARAAIVISGDGSNWSAWTTYVTGAYRGRC